jgi:DNA mismatch repair protein MutL
MRAAMASYRLPMAIAFERNAMSKLTAIKNLESLGTLGFRGEAIASIVSVARAMRQTNDGNGGTELRYDSGKKIYQKACSCKRGAFIEIWWETMLDSLVNSHTGND